MAFDPTRFMEGLPQIKPENAHEQGPVRSMNDKFRVPISFLPPLEDREDYKAGVAAERERRSGTERTLPDYRLSKPRLPAANQNQLDDEYRNGLRDQFAMAALTGILQREDLASNSEEEIADVAYLFADVMMEARKK